MEFDGQIIFLLLFVVISGIKWFIEQAKSKKKTPHETSESLGEIYDDFREEIRRRQTELQHPQEHHFQEQIHEPTPPPLPAEIAHQQEYTPEPPPRSFVVKKPQLSAHEKAALATLQQRHKAKKQRQHQGKYSLRQILASPQSTQQAIVLHEILGKPKSMQS
jgi:hypothetical protein